MARRAREQNELHKLDVEAKTRLAEAFRQRIDEKDEELGRLRTRVTDLEQVALSKSGKIEELLTEQDASRRQVQQLGTQVGFELQVCLCPSQPFFVPFTHSPSRFKYLN